MLFISRIGMIIALVIGIICIIGFAKNYIRNRDEEDKDKLIISIWLFILFGVLAFFAWTAPKLPPGYFATKKRPSVKKSTYETDLYDSSFKKDEAYMASEEFIKEKIISPSSAKFPLSAISVTDLGGGRYKVSSYVDSQNIYGAQIRKQYIVIVKDKGNDLWGKILPLSRPKLSDFKVGIFMEHRHLPISSFC